VVPGVTDWCGVRGIEGGRSDLLGWLCPAREADLILPQQLVGHQDDLVSVIESLIEKTFTEVTYASTAKLIEKIIFNMTTVFADEERLVNPDEWDSDGKPGGVSNVSIKADFVFRRLQVQSSHVLGKDLSLDGSESELAYAI
jgi:hypothetical protein